MNRSKRRFLKFTVLGTVLTPVVARAVGRPAPDSTTPINSPVPQSDVGGGMGGVDYSRFIVNTPSRADG